MQQNNKTSAEANKRFSFVQGLFSFFPGTRSLLLTDMNTTFLLRGKIFCLYFTKSTSPSRLFSARRNFPHAAEFFFVCELSGRTNRKKTKKNCAARGKFSLVEKRPSQREILRSKRDNISPYEQNKII